MARKSANPWDFVLSILDGTTEPDPSPYKSGLAKAGERWSYSTFPLAYCEAAS